MVKVKPIFLNDDELDTVYRELHNGSDPTQIKEFITKALAQTEIFNHYVPNTLELGTFKDALKDWAITKDRSPEQAECAREMLRFAKRKNQLAITVDFSFDSKEWDPDIFTLSTRKLVEYLFPEKFS